jgi:hypothetical protein
MLLMSSNAKTVRFLSIVMVYATILSCPISAQRGKIESEPKLRIVVLDGEGSINNVRTKTFREPVVLINDEKSRPVVNAMVLFTLPDNGPSGSFANGGKRILVYTDSQGRAKAKGLRPNNVPGEFQIMVNASSDGLAASATINQANVLSAAEPSRGPSKKLIAILAIVGGATAAGLAVAASGNGGPAPVSTPPTPTTSIVVGTPTFEPPQ